MSSAPALWQLILRGLSRLIIIVYLRKEVIIMCVGLPAKVIRVKDGMAIVDASGARREVSAELLDTVDPGDYVMVHAGLAIAKVTADDEEESASVLESLS